MNIKDKKRPLILPLDGFKSKQDLFAKLAEVMSSSVAEFIGMLKLNDAIHLPDTSGPELIEELHFLYPDMEIFIDFKTADVVDTIRNVLKKYPSIQMVLTVKEPSPKTFLSLRREFPQLKIALFCVGTDWKPEQVQAFFGMTPALKIFKDAENFQMLYDQIKGKDDNQFAFDMLVSSENELSFLKKNMRENMEYITPGIRDSWMDKGGQERVAGVKEALEWGVYPVIGSQLLKGNPEANISAEESRRRTFEIIDNFNQIPEINPYKGKPIGKILTLCECALTDDHFAYADGKNHGPGYVAKDSSFLHPMAVYEIGFLLAQKAVESFDLRDLHIVLGPVEGGALLAQATALHLTTMLGREILAGFADKDGDNFIIKRGYDKHVTGWGVLVVEDIVNSGGSVKKVCKTVQDIEGDIVGVIGMVNRGGVSDEEIGVDKGLFESLMNIPMTKYPVENCPLCQDKIKINTEFGHGKDFLKTHPEAANWTNKTVVGEIFASDLLPEDEKLWTDPVTENDEIIPVYSTIDG